MENQYEYVVQTAELYNLLNDKLSKNIFLARLAYDFEQSFDNEMRLISLGEEYQWLEVFKGEIPNIIQKLKQEPKKLVLYGTKSAGRVIAATLMEHDIDFYGFCARRSEDYTNGLMGKPVISPNELFQCPNDFYVIVSVAESHDEIMNTLERYHFPQDQILSSFKPANATDHQYFEFPSLFRHGTAFVDCGCLDCHTSYLFVDWCKGEYSKIFAFEPDPISYSKCGENLTQRKIRDFHLIQAGVSDHDGKASFRFGLYNSSHILKSEECTGEKTVTVPITTIDDTVGDERIGFIKMDIEGAEFDALHGTKRVITRDKPLMAISVYHQIGDMIAIMDYLHQLVPEYRFWLRHYNIGTDDTVLYASIDV